MLFHLVKDYSPDYVSLRMKKSSVSIDFILISITLIWGFNFTVVKFSLSEMSPWVFNATRYLLAIITIFVIFIRDGQPLRILKEDRLPIIGLSLLGHFIYQALFILGINFTKAANAAVILGTIPLWIAVISHFFFDEKLNTKKTIGVIMAFIGLALVIGFRKGGFDFRSEGLLGDFLMFCSAFSFGLYTLFSKKYLKKYSTTTMTMASMFSGGIWIVFAGIPGFIVLDWSSVSAMSWAGAIYSGVLSIAISYFIWNYGLKIVGAVRTSAFQNLAPIFGVIFGILLLGENLNAIQIGGAISTIVGVIVTRLG